MRSRTFTGKDCLQTRGATDHPVGIVTSAHLTMTTPAATLAMLPLAIGLGEGPAMLRALAVAIVSGLVVQLPLVLLVLPVLLSFTGEAHRARPRP